MKVVDITWITWKSYYAVDPLYVTLAELAVRSPHNRKVVGSNLASFKSDLTFSGSGIALFSHVMINKWLCQPQTTFFPIIKVSPQCLIKGISSIKPLIQRTYHNVIIPKEPYTTSKLSAFLVSDLDLDSK